MTRIMGWGLVLSGCRRGIPAVVAVGTMGHAPQAVPEADVQWHASAAARATDRVTDPARGGGVPSSTAAPLPPFLGVDRSTARYVGITSCARCHVETATLWSQTHHATAYDTLVEERAAYDPRCLRCHTQGLGHPGGFEGDESLRHVGCESCHGPGSDHVANPQPGYGDLPDDGSACVACHDLDTSPDFRWETHWPVVAH